MNDKIITLPVSIRESLVPYVQSLVTRREKRSVSQAFREIIEPHLIEEKELATKQLSLSE